MTSTLSIRRNPEFLYSEECRLAVSASDGSIHRFEGSQRRRLLEIGNSTQRLRSNDLELLEKGALVTVAASDHRRQRIAAFVREQWESTGYLTVMPTEKCNFRCTYCYEKFLKGRMSPQVVRSIRAYLKRTVPSLACFHLAWFGGEPLLHPPIVVEISDQLRRLQREYGTEGSISITTNGHRLVEKVVAQLAEIEVDVYQISLDGPREVHDRQRKTAAGHGTYDQILENIERVLELSRSRIILRMNICSRDGDAAELTSRWLEQSLFPRFERYGDRVDYHVVPIWNATTTSIDGICLKDIQRFQTWWSVKRKSLEIRDRTPSEYLAELISTPGKLSCYAGKPGSLVVGADGKLYKCTVAFDRAENQIGRLREDGCPEIDAAKEKLWTTANILTDSSCSSCALALSCQGLFCPLERLDSGHRPCPSEKRFYRQLLAESETGVPIEIARQQSVPAHLTDLEARP